MSQVRCSGWRMHGDANRAREGSVRRALLACAVLALGCAKGSGEPALPARQAVEWSGPRQLFVLPLNVTIKVPPELEPRLDDVFGAIVGYIRSGGNKVETFSRKDAVSRWALSIVEVKRSEALEDNFSSAMRVFVRELAKGRSFDAVVAPSLVYRATKVRERTAKWDGVFRKFDVVNLSDVAKKQGLAQSLSVDISGVSLHVMVFSPDGELVFQSYGGLDLVQDVDMKNTEFTSSPKLVLKLDVLGESDHLEEGIAIAFDPYLPRR
ncbi:MAG TPA: hypothetical protein VEC18_10995 [Myxococcota bacterium]|nr:hypothetical protein [Myxococcota bacterium]